MIDLLALIPFVLVVGEKGFIFRLLRIPKMLKLLEINRFNSLLMWMFGGTSRDQAVKTHYILTNVIYSIFSLLMHALVVIYFLGSIWYLISTEINSSGDRFYEDERFEEKTPV